ncbi:Alanyl-tRNA editing protein AlaX-M [Candidatus Tiddalikarchaeum anstoanum]|nr:Alanyl-tRNA editing protein AlaX-M [Candidatus Tiddalikarchaeum anstoanum]
MKYYEDAYIKELTTKIAEIGKDYIILEDTIFHPQGGGQPSDKGTINNEKVKDVKKEGSIIKHYVDASKFHKNEEVKLSIDWEYRYYLMRAHTAEHLFYQCLNKQKTITVEKINLEKNNSSLFMKGRITFEDLLNAEELIIKQIHWNFPVNIEYHYLNENLEGVRIKQDRIREEKIRVVKIGDFDKSACTGTHVRNISEIGFFIITGFKSAGNEIYEIRFEIGDDAVNKALENSTKLLQLSYETLITPENLAVSVKNALKQVDELKSEMRKLSDEFLKIKEFKAENGVIFEHFTYIDNERLIKLAPSLAKDKNCNVVFLNGNNLIIAGLQAEMLFNKLIKELGGRGGGKPELKIGRVEKTDAAMIKKLI